MMSTSWGFNLGVNVLSGHSKQYHLDFIFNYRYNWSKKYT